MRIPQRGAKHHRAGLVPVINPVAKEFARRSIKGDMAITQGTANDHSLAADRIRPDRASLEHGVGMVTLPSTSSGAAKYALAAWIRRLRGYDDRGQAIAVRHPMADALLTMAATDVLSVASLFGDLAGHPMLVRGVSDWLAAMDKHGTLGALGLGQKG